MNSKLIALTLLLTTAFVIVIYPSIQSQGVSAKGPDTPERTEIEVVFAIDTTSSMSGLIAAAKDRIWSIATTLSQGNPAPVVRMGLVAYRDRGDEYVTRVLDLTSDLDTMYQALMSFEAVGGGDGPESVNAALQAGLDEISWNQDSNTYKTLFLVGDAPPHMDYQGERQYPRIVRDAAQSGIIVNTIQCGDVEATVQPWSEIAKLGNGRYLRVEQSGGLAQVATPFDAKLAQLASDLDATRMFFGTPEEQREAVDKAADVEEALGGASDLARAERGIFNARAPSAQRSLADRDLVARFADGRLDLDALEADELPKTIAALPREEQLDLLEKRQAERSAIRSEIDRLAAQREAFLAEALESESGEVVTSFDRQLFDAVRDQAADFGIEYTGHRDE